METYNIKYSKKNIPLPNRHEYLVLLLEKIESLITRMRWKAFHFINQSPGTQNNYFGFKNLKHPPYIKEMAGFESELINLVTSIKFRKQNRINSFQNVIRKDLSNINKSKKIFVNADKSNNIYAVPQHTYKKLLDNEVTKFYKKAPPTIENDINKEANQLASKLKLAGRVDQYSLKSAFITLKDHKSNFLNDPCCRLLNPSKTSMGKISQQIVQEICESLRIALGVNQWRSTLDCIRWFESANIKNNCAFIKFDIKDFYPSITEGVLTKAIDLAKDYISLSSDSVDIIHHCRRSLLYHNGELWIKKDSDSGFDVTQGSYDGAEICELVGIFLLHNLSNTIDVGSYGIYRDDGLILMERATPRKCDILRKKLIKFFKGFGFNITIESNLRVVQFLDIYLDLNQGVVKPYKKENSNPLYINTNSNHPKNVFKHIPKGIAIRISNNSSNKEIFENNKGIYQQALKNSGYQEDLTYCKSSPNTRQSRSRKIVWFNPPFNMEVSTNIGRIFFGLLDKYFPAGSALFRIFNRNYIKLSYSCTINFDSLVKRHNGKILNKINKNNNINTHNKNELNKTNSINNTSSSTSCNCMNKNNCPLSGKCLLAKNVVYLASVICQGHKTKYYVGSSFDFKDRFYKHTRSFKYPSASNTSLSKHVWFMRDVHGIDPIIKWEIISRAPTYRSGMRVCKLCSEEKYAIASFELKEDLLNKRCEILNRCAHRRKYLLYMVN